MQWEESRAAASRALRHAEAADLSDGARAIARGLQRPSASPGSLAAIAVALDIVALGLGFWFASYASEPQQFQPAATAGMTAVLALLVSLAGWLLGSFQLGRLGRFGHGVARVLGLALPVALIAGVEPGATLLIAGFVVPARALTAVLVSAALDFGLTERRAIIVGGGERASAVLTALATSGADIRVWGIFDDRDDGRSPPVLHGVPKLGTVASLVDFVRAAEIDILIITLPLTANARIREVLKAVEVLPVDVRLSDFSDDPSFARRADGAGGGGLIEVLSRPMRQRQRVIKRALDLVGAAAAILLLSPVLLATALFIRLETPGPILFRQPRHGYNHRPVMVWKFRSMYAEACDPAARRVVTRDDPRVTRVGRVIRRWSVDELPQLFNVLAGDLSLVGPRPHALGAVSSRQEAFEAVVEGYATRHRVRPGITGWAQIHGWRGEIDDPLALRRRVEHDLHYIENWSIWLDLRILALTPLRLLDTRKAY